MIIPRWARVADATSLALIVAASTVATWGGFRLHVGGWRLALTSPLRMLLWAAALAVTRHLLVRAQPLYRRGFVCAIALGLLIRLAALPLPGTGDVGIWKVWAFNATQSGAGSLYHIWAAPPDGRVLIFRDLRASVDYPPLSLYELAVAGRVYSQANSGYFPDTPMLNVAVKAPAFVLELAFVALLFVAVRRALGVSAARLATLAYWLNPAAILDGSVLGYLDPLFVLPAAASVVAAVGGYAGIAGALATAAVLTKAQGAMLVPAIAIAVWNGGDEQRRPERLARALGGALLAGIVIIAPVVAAGALSNMATGLRSLTRHDMLSGNACNLWWIVGYIIQVSRSVHQAGVWHAVTATAGIVPISEVSGPALLGPRLLGAVCAGVAIGWACWTARGARDLWAVCALGAFLMHAYATLSAQVHENHLFSAVPLLAIASAGRRQLVPVFVTISAIVALNLNLFYGIGDGVGYAIPRAITVIDATVVLSAVNCAVLAWHAVALQRQSTRPATAASCARIADQVSDEARPHEPAP